MKEDVGRGAEGTTALRVARGVGPHEGETWQSGFVSAKDNPVHKLRNFLAKTGTGYFDTKS